MAEGKPINSLHDLLCKDEWILEDIVKFLENVINKKNSDRDTPLHFVLQHKNCSLDTVKVLLKYGADVNCKDASRETPLLIALRNSREDAVVRALIENGADVRALDSDGRSPLCVALRHRASKEVILKLLKKGCFVNTCRDDIHNGSVLHCAMANQQSVLNVDVLKMLIQRGADINAVDKYGHSVLCFALQMGNEAHFIQMLLEAGSSMRDCDIHGSPLHCVNTIGFNTPLRSGVVELLLKKGACFDQVNRHGLTPLQAALRNRKYETKAIALLLDCHKGLDGNYFADPNNNSLLIALTNPHCKASVVKLLIKHGCKVDEEYPGGHTALNVALKNDRCQPSVLRTLLKNGATVDHQCVRGAVEMHHSVEVYRVLLATGITFVRNSSVYLDLLFQSSSTKSKLLCFELFLKYSLLMSSDWHIPYLTNHHCHYKHVMKFRNECVRELKWMKLTNVSQDYTLHDFLSRSGSPYKRAEERETEVKMYDFDQLLEVINKHTFPLYFDIISDKVGRRPMKEKLPKIRMSAFTYSPRNARVENIYLPYDCVIKIANYFEDEDLLRFILAFSSTHRYKLPRQCKWKKMDNKSSE